MGQYTKASGKTTFTMAGGSCITLAETCMRESSKTTWLKDLASTSTLMEASTWAIGTRTSSMASERKNGTIQACTRAFTRMPVKKAKESICGRMAIDTLANGAKTC
jgi:hypothetical protein